MVFLFQVKTKESKMVAPDYAKDVQKNVDFVKNAKAGDCVLVIFNKPERSETGGDFVKDFKKQAPKLVETKGHRNRKQFFYAGNVDASTGKADEYGMMSVDKRMKTNGICFSNNLSFDGHLDAQAERNVVNMRTLVPNETKMEIKTFDGGQVAGTFTGTDGKGTLLIHTEFKDYKIKSGDIKSLEIH